MSEHVAWVLETKIKPGKLSDTKALITEMVEATKDESGTLIYEYFLGDNEETLHMYERYENSDAVLVHLGNFDERFGKQFFECLEPKRLIVYGNPNEAAKKAMAANGARFMPLLEGFAR